MIIEADDFLYGLGNVIQDLDEAIRIYKIAAQMGSPEAFYSLGDIFMWALRFPGAIVTLFDGSGKV